MVLKIITIIIIYIPIRLKNLANSNLKIFLGGKKTDIFGPVTLYRVS